MSNQVQVRQEQQLMSAFELEAVQRQLASLLEGQPKKIEAFKTRVLKMALSYGLKDCAPESIIGCGIQALTLDLPLEAGQGYIVKYDKQAQLDIGYKGWQVLAKRAGFSVLADVVYECDEFRQDGFGFDREITFTPDHGRRNGADDKWSKANLTGVIVSIRDDETGAQSHTFVPADTIHKIVGKSPSTQSEKGLKYGPHGNWAEQMFAAKAIKQVLSKFPIDLSKASQLHEAMEAVNVTESAAQAQPAANEYPEERFADNYPKWQEIVESGKRSAAEIIGQVTKAFNLSQSQLERLMNLRDCQPIDGEVQDAQQ